MNIGKLHQFKKYFWFLYPSKDIAVAAAEAEAAADVTQIAAAAARLSAFWSKRLNCNVSYIEPSIIFMLLEQSESGKFCKILTTNGELGWIYLASWCKKDIEEVNQ